MIKVLFFTVVILFSFMSQAFAETDELKKEVLDYLFLGNGNLTNQKEIKVANLLKREAEIYLKLMDKIGPWSFKGRDDINAETATYLLENANSSKKSMKEIISSLDEIIKGVKSEKVDIKSNTFTWFYIVRMLSVHSANFDDYQKVGLIKSDWPSFIRIILPGLFDKILGPKVALLS